MKKLLAVLVVFGLLIAATAYLYVTQALQVPGPLAADTPVYIEPGSSVKKISRQLEDAGVVSSAGIFEIGAQMNRARGGLQAGEYP